MRVGDEREYRDEGGETGLLQTDAQYPVWESTEWTPRQRTMAIRGLLLLALAFGFLACVLAVWRAGPLAIVTLLPISITLVCLGTSLLGYAFWYTYVHGSNSVGDHASTAAATYAMLTVIAVLGLVTLALQLVGCVLVAIFGWLDMRAFSISYWPLGGASLFIGAMLGAVPSILTWRPTRNPERPDSAVGAPVTGARLLLRWSVMTLARTPWLLIGMPMYFVFNLGGGQGMPSANPPIPIQEPIVLFVAAAVLFLIAALGEITYPAGATTSAPGAN